MADQPVYSIGALARMLSIPAATLRTWEERYGVVIPERSPGGHRLYSRLQVEQLRFVGDRLSDGMSAGDAYRLLQGRMAGGISLESGRVPGGDGLLILVAEQDPFAADFSDYFLRTEGYAVTVTSTAEQAMAEAIRKTPDLILIDLLISGGQGLRLCAQVRQLFDVPVLAISTLDLRDEALEAGAAAFLGKPLEPLRLVSVVRDLLGQSAYLRSGSTAEPNP
ncbi:MerR-like DNA binding protein [Kribbella voronezhensis]|uniref:MerR-like DNA binding protein n=1 Tax=Kribbella voronezhensis TaxID=2512212 RepID=A0A4R7THR8_9ACTN|nr:response regulator [Kribbella voronezhensis]TDU91186.1 MerR-like DNA binding protein [Kribbella voronezhensis]